jgi:hypothetical protein
MNPLRTTTTAWSVHHANENPIYGEGVTDVRLEDESGGCFLVISQGGREEAKLGEVRLSIEEFDLVVACAHHLMNQPSTK